MTAHARRLDTEALYAVLDRRRRERRIPWRQVASEAGLATVNLGTKLGRGSSLSADSLIALLLWLGDTDVKPYIRAGATTRPGSDERETNHA